jgi:DNA-binding CsgD family transcriptional regulator
MGFFVDRNTILGEPGHQRTGEMMVDEWRIKKRYPMTAWVDLTVPSTGTTRRGYVTNISREGVGLYYLGTVGAGTEVNLMLHMLGPTGSEIIEEVMGQVVWEDHWGGITIMGIRFSAPLGTNTPTIVDRLSRAERTEGPQAQAALIHGHRDPAAVLTAQERLLLTCMMQGLTNREIAAQLDLSPEGIDRLRGNIYTKVGLQDMVQLFRDAHEPEEPGHGMKSNSS